MIEQSIALQHALSNASPSLIYDVVFVRRNADGTELFSFNTGDVTKDSQVTFTELTLPADNGLTGQGIRKVAGTLTLSSNDPTTATSLDWLLGRLFEMHVLYTTGRYESTHYISAGKRGSLRGTSHFNRFNNIEAYRSQFGVHIHTSTDSQNYHTLTLNVDGATAEFTNGQFTTPAQFYQLFTKLNATPQSSPGVSVGS